jgi:hypothetical protein
LPHRVRRNASVGLRCGWPGTGSGAVSGRARWVHPGCACGDPGAVPARAGRGIACDREQDTTGGSPWGFPPGDASSRRRRCPGPVVRLVVPAAGRGAARAVVRGVAVPRAAAIAGPRPVGCDDRRGGQMAGDGWRAGSPVGSVFS